MIHIWRKVYDTDYIYSFGKYIPNKYISLFLLFIISYFFRVCLDPLDQKAPVALRLFSLSKIIFFFDVLLSSFSSYIQNCDNFQNHFLPRAMLGNLVSRVQWGQLGKQYVQYERHV